MNQQDLNETPQVLDVFLQPGEFYFGDQWTRIRTVLGSCVSITMWHPAKLIGGMCHYMLPGSNAGERKDPADGRYAGNAVAMFLREIRQARTRPSEYQVKLFGGGNMFPQFAGKSAADIGGKNIEMGRELLERHGFGIVSQHLAGSGHRNVIFEVWSGDVWVRHHPSQMAYGGDGAGA